jgi:hypothetical protein
MVLGMSLETITLVHVLISLAGIASGIVVMYGNFGLWLAPLFSDGLRREEATVKLLRFGSSVLLCAAMVLMSSSRSEASPSYCDGCTAAIAGTGAALAGVIGVSIYFVHRSLTSVRGCVQRSANGYSLTASDGKTFQLVNATSQLNDHHQLQLRGHKDKSASGRIFRVDRVAHDYGDCQ